MTLVYHVAYASVNSDRFEKSIGSCEKNHLSEYRPSRIQNWSLPRTRPGTLAFTSRIASRRGIHKTIWTNAGDLLIIWWCLISRWLLWWWLFPFRWRIIIVQELANCPQLALQMPVLSRLIAHTIQHNDQQRYQQDQSHGAGEEDNRCRLQIRIRIQFREEIVGLSRVPMPIDTQIIIGTATIRFFVTAIAAVVESIALQIKWNATVIFAHEFWADVTIWRGARVDYRLNEWSVGGNDVPM